MVNLMRVRTLARCDGNRLAAGNAIFATRPADRALPLIKGSRRNAVCGPQGQTCARIRKTARHGIIGAGVYRAVASFRANDDVSGLAKT